MDTNGMRDLIMEVDIRKDVNNNHPVVVHCSAGIGRTGTFVAIHMCYHKGLLQEKVDIREIVTCLRKQRPGMVQSLQQYYFIHRVAKEIMKAHKERSQNGSKLSLTCDETMLTTNGNLRAAEICRIMKLENWSQEKQEQFYRERDAQIQKLEQETQAQQRKPKLNAKKQTRNKLRPETLQKSTGSSLRKTAPIMPTEAKVSYDPESRERRKSAPPPIDAARRDSVDQ